VWKCLCTYTHMLVPAGAPSTQRRRHGSASIMKIHEARQADRGPTAYARRVTGARPPAAAASVVVRATIVADFKPVKKCVVPRAPCRTRQRVNDGKCAQQPRGEAVVRVCSEARACAPQKRQPVPTRSTPAPDARSACLPASQLYCMAVCVRLYRNGGPNVAQHTVLHNDVNRVNVCAWCENGGQCRAGSVGGMVGRRW